MVTVKCLLLSFFVTLVFGEPPVPSGGGFGGYNYNPPSSNYVAPSSSYGSPSSNYHAPAPTYSTPSSSYHSPSSNYHAPSPTFSSPSSNYHAPSSNYHAPSSSYNVPTPGYSPSYSNSNQGYNYAPQSSPSHDDHYDHGHDHHDDHSEPKSYEFGYAVKDPYTGNDYGRKETSDGNTVQGEYRVQLPDGRTQIVTYHADWKTGFHADVRYEGEARYPEIYGNNKNQFGGYPSNNYVAPTNNYNTGSNYQASNDYSGSTGFGNKYDSYVPPTGSYPQKPSSTYGTAAFH